MKPQPRSILAASLFALAITSHAQTFTWSRANVGGGGHNSSITPHPAVPGLVYSAQDVSGVFRLDPGSTTWVQLADWMPIDWHEAKGTGYVAVDPSATNDKARQDVAYTAFGRFCSSGQAARNGNGLFRTRDRGKTWDLIWPGVVYPVPGDKGGFQNYSFKQYRNQQNIAVDPANPNVLYVGTNNAGLWRSFDVRAEKPTFTPIANSPVGFRDHASEPSGIQHVVIDPRGGVVDAGKSTVRSRVVWITTPSPRPNALPKGAEAPKADNTYGVWRSTDGGETFAYIGGANAPAHVLMLTLDRSTPGGVLVSSRFEKGIRRYDGKGWSILPGTEEQTFFSIVQDPRKPERLIGASNVNRGMWRSIDGGKTWEKFSVRNRNLKPFQYTDYNWGQILAKSDATAEFIYPGESNLVLDPANPDIAWAGDPFAVLRAKNIWAPVPEWEPILEGLETTVAWRVRAPLSAKPLLYYTCADVAGVKFDDDLTKSPAVNLATAIFPNDQKRGDAVVSDVAYAPSEPTKHVALRSTLGAYYSSYPRVYRSTDSGTTWDEGHDAPPADAGTSANSLSPGSAKLAISSSNPDHWVYIGANRAPYFTTQGFSGKTIEWKSSTGFTSRLKDINPYLTNLVQIAADPGDGKSFYISILDNGQLRVWSSTDGGATWSLAEGATLPPGKAYNPGKFERGRAGIQLEAIKNGDGKTEVWINLCAQGLWRSVDKGRTFQQVAPGVVQWANGFAFGKAAPGSKVPALYVVGRVKDGEKTTDGVFLSNNLGKTFLQITPEGTSYAGGETVLDMCGDPRVYGRVFIGLNGTGVVYSTLNP